MCRQKSYRTGSSPSGLATAVLIVVATYVFRFNVERQRHETRCAA